METDLKTVTEWKELLRSELKAARLSRNALAVSALRETLAAIGNAEAPPPPENAGAHDGPFAGSTPGLGASEVERLKLTPEAVNVLVERELEERRSAAASYLSLARHDEAEALMAQAELLSSLISRLS